MQLLPIQLITSLLLVAAREVMVIKVAAVALVACLQAPGYLFPLARPTQ